MIAIRAVAYGAAIAAVTATARYLAIVLWLLLTRAAI